MNKTSAVLLPFAVAHQSRVMEIKLGVYDPGKSHATQSRRLLLRCTTDKKNVAFKHDGSYDSSQARYRQ